MSALFSHNIIALIWDFDKTLIPGYMQEPLFEEYGIDANVFWKEVNALPEKYRAQGCNMTSNEALYLNHILDYVRIGKFQGLTNKKLRFLGKKLKLFNGLPIFFQQLQSVIEQEYKAHNIRVEHYVVSTGLRQVILGSTLAPCLTGVWGCELLEEETDTGKQLSRIGYLLDHTTKTRAIFEINKGVNVESLIDVNARLPEDQRRVPISQMIYIGDGPSDVPVFSVINRYEGKSYAVYAPGSNKAYAQAYALQIDEKRVHGIGPADFSESSQTSLWLKQTVKGIANQIVEKHRRVIKDNVGIAPKHF